MEQSERIALIKKKIQEKTKNNIVEELRALNKSFNDMKYLITGSEKVEPIKGNEELIELFRSMDTRLEALKGKNDELIKSIKGIQPTVTMPSRFTVSNIKEAKADRVGVDWENMPPVRKEKKQLVEVEGLDKSLEKIIPKDEMPNDVTMTLTPRDLWSNISINYLTTKVNVKIDRNNSDVVRKLTFSRG